MSVRDFPALGFDPAPGDPAALGSAAEAVAGAGTVFGGAAAHVTRLNSSGWTGEAADAFRGELSDLPRDLDLADRAHATAARALADYGTGLAVRQRRAAELETRATALRQQESAAVAEVNRLAGRTAPSGSPEFTTLKDQYDAARSRATSLGSAVHEVIAEARRLHTEHRSAAAEAARALRRAADTPYEEPGWLSRRWSAVTGWITDHADTLRGISTVLKGISAVLGVLSFVPGLQFLAPFAVGLGVAALVIDGALGLAGEGDWKSFAIDAALTVLPTGPVVRAFRRAPGVARGLDATGDALAGSRLASRLPFLQRIPPSPLEQAGNRLPRLAESQLTRNADGLVTHVDDVPVRDYLRTTSTERATQMRAALERMNVNPKDSPAYALSMDRRSGHLEESVNGWAERMKLHDPLIRRRIAELDAADAAGRPYRYSADPRDVGDWVHPSVPGTHAEVSAASRILDHRRGARLPVSDDVLARGEVVVDVQDIRKAAVRPFGCCANCSRILRDVPSASGRFTSFPHQGQLSDLWTAS